MGKKDAVTKEYVRRPEVFADAFNQYVYRGSRAVQPEKLRELDTAQIMVPYGEDDAGVPEQRYRDAPLTLKEMYDCEDENLLAYAADYRVNLLAPGNLTDEEIELFQTDLREVMQYIKYSKDKEKIADILEKNEHFKKMDRGTAEVLNAVTNSKLKFHEKEENVSMCLALDEIREDCRAEGRVEGRAEGERLKLITLLCRKLAKGKTPEVIAEELEEEIGEIERIYRVAVKYAPDYDADEIYAELGA